MTQPTAWDVSSCREYVSDNEDIRARGVYVVDTTRGSDIKDQWRFLKQGSFGIVVDVLDIRDKKYKEYVPRR